MQTNSWKSDNTTKANLGGEPLDRLEYEQTVLDGSDSAWTQPPKIAELCIQTKHWL